MIRLTKKEDRELEVLIRGLLKKYPIKQEGDHYCLAFHIDSVVNYLVSLSEAQFMSIKQRAEAIEEITDPKEIYKGYNFVFSDKKQKKQRYFKIKGEK